MAKAEKRIEKRQNAFHDALATGDDKLIEEAEERLKRAKKAVTLQDKRFAEMVSDTAKRMSDYNKIAIDYANDQMPKIYAMNYNSANGIAKTVGLSWSMVNESTVKSMIKKGEIYALKKKHLSYPKDQRWNAKQMNSAVLQGILQGESMPDIAKRIEPIVGRNERAAITQARTLVTQAENRGRWDSQKRLQDMGAVLKRYWIAVGDSRTREWHLVMDGQERDIDEPFEDGHGNTLDCPADPNAPIETVYNCRCGMGTIVIGYKKEDGSIVYV